ncbi:MAG: HD domain-containing protein [Anaerolineae bacterium]|nr:HD domain-containing protein [Anaerolineae bacterium]
MPTRHNEKLKALVAAIDADEELAQWWRCANVNVVDRQGMTDHGEVHIRIVANAALKLLRLLVEGGVQTSIEANYQMSVDDAEVVVVAAAALHDVGIAVHRDNHEQYSIPLAAMLLPPLLRDIYPPAQRVIVQAETLHAISAHRWSEKCLTIEAGVVKVADTLDMTQGRSRIPYEMGETSIHTISAAAIDAVRLTAGVTKPIRIEIEMSNSAGVFQVDELLKRKLRNSSIAPYVEVVAHIEGETEKRLLEFYSL